MPSLGISSCCFFEFIRLPGRKVLGVCFFYYYHSLENKYEGFGKR